MHAVNDNLGQCDSCHAGSDDDEDEEAALQLELDAVARRRQFTSGSQSSSQYWVSKFMDQVSFG